MLTDEHVEQFRALFKTHFGKEITKEEAHERGMKLVTLLKAIDKPITS